jgi:hypothetical protein
LSQTKSHAIAQNSLEKNEPILEKNDFNEPKAFFIISQIPKLSLFSFTLLKASLVFSQALLFQTLVKASSKSFQILSKVHLSFFSSLQGHLLKASIALFVVSTDFFSCSCANLLNSKTVNCQFFNLSTCSLFSKTSLYF